MVMLIKSYMRNLGGDSGDSSGFNVLIDEFKALTLTCKTCVQTDFSRLWKPVSFRLR